MPVRPNLQRIAEPFAAAGVFNEQLIFARGQLRAREPTTTPVDLEDRRAWATRHTLRRGNVKPEQQLIEVQDGQSQLRTFR